MLPRRRNEQPDDMDEVSSQQLRCTHKHVNRSTHTCTAHSYNAFLLLLFSLCLSFCCFIFVIVLMVVCCCCFHHYICCFVFVYFCLVLLFEFLALNNCCFTVLLVFHCDFCCFFIFVVFYIILLLFCVTLFLILHINTKTYTEGKLIIQFCIICLFVPLGLFVCLLCVV